MDEHPGAIWAAGVAAVALVVVLVIAVIDASDSSEAPKFGPPPPSSDGPSSSVYTGSSPYSLSSTSYGVPSVQTSEDTGAPVIDPPTPGDPATDEPATTTTTSTTTTNPYGTTTPTNAGHV